MWVSRKPGGGRGVGYPGDSQCMSFFWPRDGRVRPDPGPHPGGRWLCESRPRASTPGFAQRAASNLTKIARPQPAAVYPLLSGVLELPSPPEIPHVSRLIILCIRKKG